MSRLTVVVSGSVLPSFQAKTKTWVLFSGPFRPFHGCCCALLAMDLRHTIITPKAASSLVSTVDRLPSTVYRLPPGVAAWGSRRAGGVKGRVTLLLLPKQFQKSGCRRSEVIYTAVVYLDACGTGRYNCSSLDNTKHSTCSLQTAVILPPNAPREANAPRVAIFDENENNPDFHIVTPPPLSTFWGERPGAYLVNAPCQSFWGA